MRLVLSEWAFIEDFDVGNLRMLGCQKYKLDRLFPQALAELPREWGWPTHSSTTTRSMRFMSGLADHPGVGSVGPSHHAGRHTPSMFSPLRYCVFGSLYRPSPDDLPSRLRLEYCWLLCERIDAAPLLCGGLLDDNEFGESGHKEGSRFLELFVAYLGKRLDDALDVLMIARLWHSTAVA